MGAECECKLKFHRKTISGKAQLESDHLLFRGTERLKIMFKDLSDVQSRSGLLTLTFPGGPATFELGERADKWAHKILHPPSRLDKLGVKNGSIVQLFGTIEPSFLHEMSARKVKLEDSGAKRDFVFVAAEKMADLAVIAKLSSGLKADGSLWVIYPRGITVIREIQVLEAGRAAGLKDVKVASFSATHTALKFVIPLSAR